MATIVISVVVKGHQERYVHSITVPEFLEPHFAPVDMCDDPRVSLMVPNGISRQDVFVKYKRRKDASKILAEALTEHILESMKAEDTRNGYKD